MAAAARVHLVESGKDPRVTRWWASAAPGRRMRSTWRAPWASRSVLIPPASGAASALGFLVAPLSFDDVRSLRVELKPGFDAGAVNRLLHELEQEGLRHLERAGIARGEAMVERSADMRLVGQMHEISVPLPLTEIGDADLAEIREAFVRAYSRGSPSPSPGHVSRR